MKWRQKGVKGKKEIMIIIFEKKKTESKKKTHPAFCLLIMQKDR